MGKQKKLLLSCVVLALLLMGTKGNCVRDNTTSLRACFDPLVNLTSQHPTNISDFLCRSPQKELLQCVIKHFTACPAFDNASFIDGLEDSKSGFHALDLFHVTSADDFCVCSSHEECLRTIKTDKLSETLEGGPWKQIANSVYICGDALPSIQCVSQAPSKCADYLQYKHDTSSAGVKLNVTSFKDFSTFADEHCSSAHKCLPCATKRATWLATEVCYNDTFHFRLEKDRTCGIRSCIQQAMASCPVGEMEYFIAAVNLYLEEKVDAEDCDIFSDATGVYTSSFMFMFCVTLTLTFLF